MSGLRGGISFSYAPKMVLRMRWTGSVPIGRFSWVKGVSMVILYAAADTV
ncbi:hypothetical protein AA14337_1275 [Acetobacter malorum DSM 14337]|uniref:Uncharacterized protein n=1 Tax=Acetobacter malorum DSM 14337 TaxID=1307910 RepID=A0ABQ0PRM2_9PROT|nr:hypothetical protein AA14337_1275 [Acetobacter malorum DSM 14337]